MEAILNDTYKISAMKTRATLIAAPSSHQGKTIFTAALARHYVNAGLSVKIIKLGPDYLDPMIHETASRQSVLNLDWWMMGESHCRKLYQHACEHADVVLIESLMGLHDNTPSNAWIAEALDIPVTLVVNMAKFAQTSAAIVYGMCSYGTPFKLHGVIGNRLGSQHHHTLVSEALNDHYPYLGSLRRDDNLVLPQRHLGLVQAEEIERLDDMLDEAAKCLQTYDINTELPTVNFTHWSNGIGAPPKSYLLKGQHIAIAKDAAFSFIYPENLALLKSLGASTEFFSPLAGDAVPHCSALWLPGGYPELHLETLSKQKPFLDSLRQHIQLEKPTLAECGGMMVLGRSITDIHNNEYTLCDITENSFIMKKRFQSVGYQRLTLDGQSIRGHSFHHSQMLGNLQTPHQCETKDGNPGELFFDNGNLRRGYMHFYFPSNPQLTASFFS